MVLIVLVPTVPMVLPNPPRLSRSEGRHHCHRQHPSNLRSQLKANYHPCLQTHRGVMTNKQLCDTCLVAVSIHPKRLIRENLRMNSKITMIKIWIHTLCRGPRSNRQYEHNSRMTCQTLPCWILSFYPPSLLSVFYFLFEVCYLN